MSGRDFFISRYEELGWKYHDITLEQTIRINTMNIEATDIVERLKSIGIDIKKVPFLNQGYWASNPKFSVGATSEYLLGFYSIQEAAAQIPVTLFTHLEDKKVLDACAAPGGKTVQMADSMHNTGVIIALDLKKERLAALANHLERCRINNTIVHHMDARHATRLGISFDGILLDMPCSGNFAADKNWFKRRTLKDVERNAALQKEILTETLKTLADDGEIVYSTCSLEPEEDELNIDWAIRSLNLKVQNINCLGQKGLTNVFGKRLDSSVEKCRRIWPEQTQGFFVCKLKKEGKRSD